MAAIICSSNFCHLFLYTRELGRSGDVRVYRITFPSAMVTPFESNNTVPAELYLPENTSGKIPAAVVLDILDGKAILPRMMARSLASRGVAAIYFPMPYYGVRAQGLQPAHARRKGHEPRDGPLAAGGDGCPPGQGDPRHAAGGRSAADRHHRHQPRRDDRVAAAGVDGNLFLSPRSLPGAIPRRSRFTAVRWPASARY